jgi:hypothetical protein
MRKDGGMKTLLGSLPQNVIPYRLADLAINGLSQEMMRSIRRVTDLKRWTVEDVMCDALDEFLAKCEAESELEMKVIRFPTRRSKPRLSRSVNAHLRSPATQR